MNRLIVFGLIAAVSCNDLIQGPEGGRKIYDEDKEASPTIWKRNDEVTIKTNETDVIRRIVITDQRPDKDGEAKIVEGGQGQKNVTIQLKSPTVLRGYDFHIEVYAVSENEQEINEPEVSTELSNREEVTTYVQAAPVMENDTNVNDKGVNVKESDKSLTEDREVLTGQEKVPIMTDRRPKNTDISDPIAQYVNENPTGKVLAEKTAPLKSYSLLLPDSHPSYRSHGEQRETTATIHDETKNQKETTATTERESNEQETKVIPMHGLLPHLLTEEEIKTVQKTTEATRTYTTEKLNESDMKRYQDISKELGQHVVFGIKRGV